MPQAKLTRPTATEYAPYYGTYISKVPDEEVLGLLERQRRETRALLEGIPESQALHRYAPGKWSIKEVIGHLCDAERVFAYRAMRFARGDASPLASFDEKTYVPAGEFDARPLADLAAEFDHVRQATIDLLRGLPAGASERRGVASGHDVSVRALAFIIAGHERHRLAIIRERYLAGN